MNEIKRAEYESAMAELAAACRLIVKADLESLFEHLDKFERLVPLIDPAAWRSGGREQATDERSVLTAAASARQQLWSTFGEPS